MSFSYASPGSGLSAGGIGWANFGNLTLIPGGAGYNFSGTLNNGVKVTFTAAAQNIAGDPRSFTAVSTPHLQRQRTLRKCRVYRNSGQCGP